MTFFIVHVGEPKEDYFKKAFDEYKKRLLPEEVNDIAIKPFKTHGSDTGEGEVKLCLEREGKSILSVLESNKIAKSYKIALCIEGKELSSKELSDKILELKNMGKSSVTFVIGGSWGLTDEVKNKCDMKLSFSKMTFPHSLFRVMLIEQIYRAVSILDGKQYHK